MVFSMQQEMQAGWKFSSKQMGAEYAAQIGDSYIHEVDAAIEELAKDMQKLGANNLGVKQLKGFVAEYWHADTFNIDAALKESANRTHVDGSIEHASVDLSTNFGKSYSSKYIRTYDESVKAQAKNVIQAYHEYLSKPRKGEAISFEQYLERYGYIKDVNVKKLIEDYKGFLAESGKDSSMTLEQFIKLHTGEYDITTLLTSVYNGQERLIPTDQIQEAIKYLKMEIAKEGGKDTSNRAAVLANYQETLEKLVDRISDGQGTESVPLTKEEAEAIAELIKEGKFRPEDFGISLNDLVTVEYILNQALKAGYTAAAITLVLQLGPEIIKGIYLLIKNREIDIEQLKKTGKVAISAGAEGFLRGSIASALTMACKAGKLGEGFVNVNPHVIGALTVICLDVVKSSMLVAAGKITPREMGATITKEILISSAALAGGAIVQVIAPELPVIGYMLGSLIGSCLSSVLLNVGEKCLISFCVDSGFTCFGLVEQNYELPEEVLRDMGLAITAVSKVLIKHTEVKEVQVKHTQIKHTQLSTVQLIMVKRGVIGVNKIGYVS